MKQLLLFTIILMLNHSIGHSQSLRKSEKFALKCLNEKFIQAGTSNEYVLTLIDEFEESYRIKDLKEAVKLKAELDSIFIIAGFSENGQLNFQTLINCLESKYDYKNSKDTLSSYYRFLDNLKLINNNSDMYYSYSPELLFGAIMQTISGDDREKEIFKVYSFILFESLFNKNIRQEEISNSTLFIDSLEAYPIVIDENLPTFPGGTGLLYELIYSEMTDFPDSIEIGKVYVEFTVNENGEISNPKLLNSKTIEIDNEAIRIVNTLPNFTPVTRGGRKIKSSYVVVIDFNKSTLPNIK